MHKLHMKSKWKSIQMHTKFGGKSSRVRVETGRPRSLQREIASAAEYTKRLKLWDTLYEFKTSVAELEEVLDTKQSYQECIEKAQNLSSNLKRSLLMKLRLIVVVIMMVPASNV